MPSPLSPQGASESLSPPSLCLNLREMWGKAGCPLGVGRPGIQPRVCSYLLVNLGQIWVLSGPQSPYLFRGGGLELMESQGPPCSLPLPALRSVT